MIYASNSAEDDVDTVTPEARDAHTRLAEYQYLPAIKADLLHRLGRPDEALIAYQRALELTANEAERQFLAERIARS